MSESGGLRLLREVLAILESPPGSIGWSPSSRWQSVLDDAKRAKRALLAKPSRSREEWALLDTLGHLVRDLPLAIRELDRICPETGLLPLEGD